MSAAHESEPNPTDSKKDTTDDAEMLEATLFRLTQGLPKAELELIISESEVCEVDLVKDIEILEKAANDESSRDNEEVKVILDSLLTPMDQHWTASALVGRLRGDMVLPTIPTAMESPYAVASQANAKQAPVEESAMISLTDMPAYSEKHNEPNDLMNLYKKLSAHRSALVFRKPVRDEEAPGYSDRIQFRMDLGLIRKLIAAGIIASYQEFHKYTALISHNCVKFNGRESDYGVLAREFEQAADEMVRHAVMSDKVSSTTPTPATEGGMMEATTEVQNESSAVAAESTSLPKSEEPAAG